jgi:outer membrane protein assembly factor BamB
MPEPEMSNGAGIRKSSRPRYALKPIGESRVASSQENHTIIMAPRIANDKVIISAAGVEFPTWGFLSAFDVLTGELAWSFYAVPGNKGAF